MHKLRTTEDLLARVHRYSQMFVYERPVDKFDGYVTVHVTEPQLDHFRDVVRILGGGGYTDLGTERRDPWRLTMGAIVSGGTEIRIGDGYNRSMVLEIHPNGTDVDVNDRIRQIKAEIMEHTLY